MKTSKVYETEKVEDLKQLLERTVEKYPNNIAYKYKKNHQSETPEYI